MVICSRVNILKLNKTEHYKKGKIISNIKSSWLSVRVCMSANIFGIFHDEKEKKKETLFIPIFKVQHEMFITYIFTQ